MSRYWFISSQQRPSAYLTLITVILAFIVITAGAFTRLTNAGLSCPDWPGCFGQLTAPHTVEQMQAAAAKYPSSAVNSAKSWTEMGHRYLAGLEGILILFLSGSILLSKHMRNWKSITIALLLIALLACQVLLGMLTVTEKLKPVIVLMHLLTGISILSVLWWMYIDLQIGPALFVERAKTYFSPFIWLGFLFVIMQITLGGWVTTHYAGLACIDFPYCNGTLLPTLHLNELHTHLITIHMLHRIGAAITGTYLILLCIAMLGNRYFRTLGWLLVLLIALQITLGVLNIIWLRPLWIALMHQSVAIFILLTMITALVKASYLAGRQHDYWVA